MMIVFKASGHLSGSYLKEVLISSFMEIVTWFYVISVVSIKRVKINSEINY